MVKYTPELQKNARVTGQYSKVVKTLMKCNFCDLKDKYIIAEKDNMVLTVNLFPYIDFHTLIIPRRHVKEIHELKKEEWAAVKYLSDLTFGLYRKFFNIKDVNLLYREGNRSQKTVEHLHFNVVPFRKDLLKWNYQEINVAPIEVAKRMRNTLEGLPLDRGNPCQVEVLKDLVFKEASKSKCQIVKNACAAVKDGEILLTAYNRILPDEDFCEREGCIRKKWGLGAGRQLEHCYAVHAEANLISKAARKGINLEGATLYSTTFPCNMCARAIVVAGIKRLVYFSDYVLENGRGTLEKAGVGLVKYEN